MTAGESARPTRFELHGTTVEARIAGSGRTILFLSAGFFPAPDATFAGELARLGQVTAPIHPGFDTGEPPRHLANADDLAYLYLDLLDEMKAEDCLVVGASFGGFVAAQMAVKSCRRIGGLVLVDPVGLRPGKRDERDYADVFATADPDLDRLAFAAPERFGTSPREMPEPELVQRIRAREALARYVWQPFMHDPRLAHKLHRIGVPTLVLWGAADGIAKRTVAEAYAEGIAGARLEVIANAGHVPHVEQPAAVVTAIEGFIGGATAAPQPKRNSAKPKGAR